MRLARYFFVTMAVAGAAVYASSCGSPSAPSDAAVTSLDESLESVEADSAVQSESTFVIRDAETFKRLWTQVFSRRTEREMPVIDFTKQMVVIVTMGPQPTTGYGIRITGVRRGGRGIIVDVETLSPGPNCVVAQQRTFPIAMARLRRFDGQVNFEFKRTVRDCSGK